MPTVIKKEKNRKSKGQAVIAQVSNYANEPYFQKKADEAKQTIEKFGLPKQ